MVNRKDAIIVVNTDDLIIKMHQNGVGYEKIAQIMDISLLEVNRCLDRNGISRFTPKYEERDKNICEWYQQGLGIAKIAKKLGIDRHTVSNVLKRNCLYAMKKSY